MEVAIVGSGTQRGVTHVKFPRDSDHMPREIFVDAPIAALVGLGQRALGNVAANAQMVQLCVGRAQTRDGVAEAVESGELSEGHA